MQYKLKYKLLQVRFFKILAFSKQGERQQPISVVQKPIQILGSKSEDQENHHIIAS